MNWQMNPSKAKVNVAYSPTSSNSIIVSKIRHLPMLDGIAFTPLPEKDPERREALVNMTNRERTLFLWGDGHHHDESYHFTSRPLTSRVRRLKVNLDAHSDEYVSMDDGGDIDFETHKPLRGNLKFMTFANHMSCTEAEGVEIFTTEKMNVGVLTEMADIFVQIITNRGIVKFMDIACARALSFDGEVDLTLDLDLVRGMAVELEFMQKRDSVGSKGVLEALKMIMPRVSVFDMGGIVSQIPDFNLIEGVLLGKPPKEDDVQRFILASENPELARENKGMIDFVGSYAAMTIANAIRIFSETRE
ncbi:MAG: hypothetical protein ABH983_03100 [Candidatus Micrarchaeota archaeon]|nr:hypothetical protein [Candidatus Micrarchaeota archaeon]